MNKLKFLKQDQINYKKWNTLIEQYSKGLPYAYSWYLDSVCEHWNVIIYKDYEAGFAFQIKKKYGIAYSFHPFLIQQLGFFGSDNSIFNLILSEIERKVFHYHYQLNYFNQEIKNTFEIKDNYELFLSKNIEGLRKNYNSNNKRNIKKSKSNNITINIENNINESELDFIKQNGKLAFNGIKKQQFKKLMINANKNSSLEIYKAFVKEELVSVVIFIKNNLRAVYLIAASNAEGKTSKANFLIVDTFIQNHANSNIILDFEGSNIQGIARFYSGFGAKKTTYQSIKKSSLKNIISKLI